MIEYISPASVGVDIYVKFGVKKENTKWLQKKIIVELNSRLPIREIEFPMFAMLLMKPTLRRNVYM